MLLCVECFIYITGSSWCSSSTSWSTPRRPQRLWESFGKGCYIYIYRERERWSENTTVRAKESARAYCYPSCPNYGFIFWGGDSIMREYRRSRVPLLNPRWGVPSGYLKTPTNSTARKGQLGSALIGSLHVLCLFLFNRGTVWVLPLTYFHIPRSAWAYPFSPICQN